MRKELETAVRLAREAGDVILEFYEKGFAVEEKRTKDNLTEPVTEADRAASELIVAGLEKVFPTDGILSEEADDVIEKRLSRQRVWIIDPIDGTKGFVEKAGDFAVQIGLAEAGVPVVGVVFQPLTDVLYFAVKNEGAFVVEQKGEPQRLQVSAEADFSQMTIAASRSHHSAKMSRLVEDFGFAEEIRHGSVGLKIGLLARQKADSYIHLSPRTKFWDTCAPQIILEEAGGILTDLFGEKITYNTEETQNLNGVLASNAAAHQKTLLRLKPLLTEFGRLRVKIK